MTAKLFQKYRARLQIEAVLKAFLIGASVGFGTAALTALVSWFFGFKAGIWLAIGLFAAVTAAVTAGLYLKKFRPTTKSIAARVDELGLEERVLTMTELEGDDSFIAVRQREDTLKALGSVSHLLLKIAVTASMIVAVVVSGVAFGGLMTVNGLYAADVIPSGIELLSSDPVPDMYLVNYSVMRGTEGAIYYHTDDWDNGQLFDEEISVYAGEDAPAVLAVPARGWVFSNWSDGSTEPYRHDLAVGGSIDVKAVFIKLNIETEEDEPLPAPSVPGSNKGGPGDSGGSGDNQQPPQDTNTNWERNDSSTQVENGQTYYGDGFDSAMDSALGGMGDNVSGDLQGSVGDYFDSLNPGSGSGDEGDAGDAGDAGGNASNP